MTAASNPLSATVNNVTHSEQGSNFVNHKKDHMSYTEAPISVPPLGNLRRSLDLS